VKNLLCANLSLGGGLSQVPDNATPPGAINRFTLSCAGPNCNIGTTASGSTPRRGRLHGNRLQVRHATPDLECRPVGLRDEHVRRASPPVRSTRRRAPLRGASS